MEKFNFEKPKDTNQSNFDKYLREVNAEYIQKNINPTVLENALKLANEDCMEKQELFRGYEYSHPNQKALMSIQDLSEDIKQEVTAHGVGSHIKGSPEKYQAVHALIDILSKGELIGDYTSLENNAYATVFTDAPFILLSNKGEDLAAYDNDKLKLKSLRTVLVNGQYEYAIDNFKKAFPWISFRKAEEIDDGIFDKRTEEFKSWVDKINEKIAN